MAGPAAAASPIIGGCSIPNVSMRCCSISAAPAAAARRAAANDNTLPHLIADMEMIREKFGFERWMVVGGSWGATLALAYAQAHPDRVSGIVLRATFLGTRGELEGAFLDALPRFYPDLSEDFLERVAGGGARAAARCLLAPHSRFRSRGAWPGRPRLARHRADSVRARARRAPGSISSSLKSTRRAARHAVHGSALFRRMTAS